MNVVGPQAFVADRNLERALDPSLVPAGGRTGPRRARYLASLGDEAIPAVVAAYDRAPGRGPGRRSTRFLPAAGRGAPRPTRRSRAGRRGTSPGSGHGPRSRRWVGPRPDRRSPGAAQRPAARGPPDRPGRSGQPPGAARPPADPAATRTIATSRIAGSHTMPNQIAPRHDRLAGADQRRGRPVDVRRRIPALCLPPGPGRPRARRSSRACRTRPGPRAAARCPSSCSIWPRTSVSCASTSSRSLTLPVPWAMPWSDASLARRLRSRASRSTIWPPTSVACVCSATTLVASPRRSPIASSQRAAGMR